MMTIHRCLQICLALCALGAAAASHAQVERSPGGESQRIMQQYQQLAAEKTALQAQVTQLKKDLDSAQSDLASTRKERDAIRARVGAATAAPGALAQAAASRDAAEKNLAAYKQRLEEIIGKYRELAATLRQTEADRGVLGKQLGERNVALDKCARNNAELYKITSEVLDRYEHVGIFTRVSASEPFTRVTRTRIENLVDEYRQRALDSRTPVTPAPAP